MEGAGWSYGDLAPDGREFGFGVEVAFLKRGLARFANSLVPSNDQKLRVDASKALEQFVEDGFSAEESIRLTGELVTLASDAIAGDPISLRKVFNALVRIHREPGFGEHVKKGHCGMPFGGYKVTTGKKDMFRIFYRVVDGKPSDIDIGNRADVYKGKALNYR